MTIRKLIIPWILVCAIVVGLGFYKRVSDGFGLQSAQSILDALGYYSGIGAAAATCLVTGLHVVNRVRRGSLQKGSGIAVVLYSSAISAIAPPLILVCFGWFTGMSALGVVIQAFWTLGIALFAFVAFSLVILCCRPR